MPWYAVYQSQNLLKYYTVTYILHWLTCCHALISKKPSPGLPRTSTTQEYEDLCVITANSPVELSAPIASCDVINGQEQNTFKMHPL